LKVVREMGFMLRATIPEGRDGVKGRLS